jgi:hypothetical protein
MKKFLLSGFFLTVSILALAHSVDTCKIDIDTILEIDALRLEYRCNGIKCNGCKISLWDNGNCHIRGCFKDGLAFDTLEILNINNEIEEFRFVDSLNVTWYFTKKGELDYSSTNRHEIMGGGVVSNRTYYDRQVKKLKTIYRTTPPSSLIEWTVLYDTNAKEYLKISFTNLGYYLIVKKINNHLPDTLKIIDRKLFNIKKAVRNKQFRERSKIPITELSFLNLDRTYLLFSSFYKNPPTQISEIIDDSIVTYFQRINGRVYIFDINKNKFFRLKNKNNP